jgi:hypothetical protein
MKSTTLHTDGAHAYEAIGADMAGHFAVDHSAGQYVIPGSNGTNMAENYFSQLKRSLDGTHHHVSVEHLPRYLAEFDFRYTYCADSGTARMNRLMGRVAGRRLQYRGKLRGMTDVAPEGEGDELGGRVNTDLPFEDVLQVMLDTDLRDTPEDAEAE